MKRLVLLFVFINSFLACLTASTMWRTEGCRNVCVLFERNTWNATDATDDEPGYDRSLHIYTDEISVPAEWSGKHFSLWVGAANQECWVRVNGDSVGYHAGGYTAFSMDVTKYLRYGQKNKIELLVSNAYNPSIPPLSADFTFFGGVYRDVKLFAVDNIHFETNYYSTQSLFIRTPKVSEKKANVVVWTNVAGSGEVRFRLKGGNTAEEKLVRVKNGRAEVSFTVKNPALWSPASPNLYRVECDLYDKAGKPCDRVEERFGLRWYEFGKDGQFYLNGKQLKLIGTNRHQCYAGMGNALPDSIHRSDMEAIRRMGANFVRISHYPQDEQVMRMCDSLGLLCSVEIPVVNAISETEAFAQTCIGMCDEMVWQNYNHPSVVIWGYSNEILLRPPYKSDPERHALYCEHTVSLARRLNAHLKQLDPDRYTMIVLHDNLKEYHQYGFTSAADVIGLNLYSGWYSGVFEGLDAAVERARSATSCPLLITEYGADCDARIRSSQPERFDYSVDYSLAFHRYYLAYIQKSPLVAGGMVWNYNDFHSETRGGAIPHFNLKGLVTSNRTKKMLYYFYQSELPEDSIVRKSAETQLVQMLEQPHFEEMPLRVLLGTKRSFQENDSIVWRPEQAYHPGSWGYVGGRPFVVKTRHGVLPVSDSPIGGTDLDPIYQNARAGIEQFRADVPSGRYAVVLYLAELESKEEEAMSVYNLGNEKQTSTFNGRVMTIEINGREVLSNLDLTNSVGCYQSVQYRYEIETDGGIVVDLRATQGESLLSAVSIEPLPLSSDTH